MSQNTLAVHERPGILERLTAACSAGDLGSVQTVIGEWRAMDQPEPERGDEQRPMYYLHPALAVAIRNGHMSVVSHLLDDQFRPDDAAVKAAIETPRLDALSMFLDHGWNINKLQRSTKPPMLS